MPTPPPSPPLGSSAPVLDLSLSLVLHCAWAQRAALIPGCVAWCFEVTCHCGDSRGKASEPAESVWPVRTAEIPLADFSCSDCVWDCSKRAS